MALDIDLIGVIAAACVSSLFIIALVTLLACKSCKVLNKHREERLLNKLRHKYRPEWSMFQTETTDTASESGYSDQAFKMANYTPKILRRSISQEQIFAHGKHDRKYSKDKKRNERHMQHSYSNGEQKPKAMSVIHVSGKKNGTQHPQENGSVTRGESQKSPNHAQDYVIQTEVHHVPENRAEVEHEHVLAENENSRADVHNTVTPVTGQGAHEYDIQDNSGSIYEECYTPEGHSVLKSHLIRQDVNAEEDGKVKMSVETDEEKMVQNIAVGEETTQESSQSQSLSFAVESAPSMPPSVLDTNTLHNDTRLYDENSPTATRSHPYETHIILSSEEKVGHLDQHQAPFTTAFSSNEITTQHPDTVVGSGNAHNAVEVAAVHNVYPRYQSNIQTKEHYYKKGIRRKPHDEHASLPIMWTLREQPENGSSLNIDENKSLDVDVTNGVSKPESQLSSTGMVGDNVDDVDTGYSTSIEVQNKDTQFVPLGNAEPETTKGRVKNMVFNINRQSLDETENEASTSSNIAMKAMRMRRMVDESAEKIPPVFTSTPRLPLDAPDSMTSDVIDSKLPDTNSRRQRLEHDGSIRDLPPPPSDWLSDQDIQ